MTKSEIRRSVRARQNAAYALIGSQWRRCFWTRPFGHVRDGTTGRYHHYTVCLYCGKPAFGALDSVKRLETVAAEAHLYPIANQESKREVAA